MGAGSSETTGAEPQAGGGTPTVVVGYDGSEPARAALDRAVADAEGSKAHLVVVAVVELPLNPEGPQNFGTLDDSPARMIPLVEPEALAPIFAEARRRLEGSSVSADYVWAAGDPAGAIAGAARDRGASLVVLGAGHHGRLARWFGTDVAAEVERTAGCEVLVVDSA